MKLFNKIILALALVVAGTCMAQAGKTTITAKLDSTLLLMGKTTALHLEIVQDKGKIGIFPLEQSDTLSSAIEIAGKTAIP